MQRLIRHRINGCSLLQGLPFNAAQAGMGVLDIKNRIFLALFFSEIEIELDQVVGLAHEEEKTQGIGADLVDQLIDGDKGGFAGRHLHLLAFAEQGDELVKNHGDPGIVIAERPDPGHHIGHGGDVVGAENIDHPVIAALEFIAMVGDVRQPVGGLAGTLDDHPILFLAETRRS